MDYKLTKGQNSNYEVEFVLTPQEYENFKKQALKHFQKQAKIPGFRPGHAPLEMVEKQVSPEYVKVATLEEAINQGFKKVVKENPNIKFIGDIYDLQHKEEKNWNIKISFKIDVYPQVEVLNENWKTYQIEPIQDQPTPEEIEQTINTIRLQNAQYQDWEKVDSQKSVVKLDLDFLDKDNKSLETGKTIIGPEDFEEFPTLKTLLENKKVGDEIEAEYNPKQLGPLFTAKKAKPKKVKIKIQEIKYRELPELTDQKIKELFWDEVKGLEGLKQRIKELMQKEKRNQLLAKAVEDFVAKAQESFDVKLPQTIIQSETNARLQSLAQRLGGEEGLKKYLASMPQDQQQKMIEEIQTAAKESLKKFFILQKILEELKINADWNKPGDVEEKLYQKLVKQTNNKK